MVSVALVAACGGGGDGSGTVTSTSTFAVNTAFTQLATTGAAFAASAADGADNWTLSLAYTPSADTTFESESVKATNAAITIKKNGATVLSSGGQSFFTINPYMPKGLILNSGPYGVQTTAAATLSDALTVGSSASLGVVTVYTSALKNTVSFTQEGTFTLEADTANTAFACSNVTARNTSGAVITTSAICLKIQPNGTVLGVKYTLAVEGKTLVFR